MSPIKKAAFVIILASMLLASAIPAYAIGFDAEETYESVFVIYAGNALGSGFAIGENLIVTNAHVVEDIKNPIVVTYSGENYDSSVYLLNDKIDIAVLLVSDVSLQPLPVASADSYSIGDDIYTIGAPNSMAYTLTKGVISAKERNIGNQTYIQIDAAVNSGNSGGPLLNDSGEVLGVNTLKVSNSEGIGLSIPMTTVCDYLEECGVELDEHGNVSDVLEVPATTSSAEPSPTPEDTDSEIVVTKSDSILVILLSLSVVLNVILIGILACKKKKNPAVMVSPAERTDFEIEIQE